MPKRKRSVPSEATREKNRQRERERHRLDPESNRKRVREWVSSHKERKKQADKQYYLKNKEKLNANMRVYHSVNAESIKKQALKRQKQRRVDDEQYMLTCRMRARLGAFLREHNIPKQGHTYELMGCTPNELQEKLQALCNQGESLHSMECDHIFPLCRYKLKYKEEQRMAMDVTNMQPLTVQENRDKGDKLPTKAMADRVEQWAWPKGVKYDDLPDIYEGWATPLRMH